MNYQAPALTSIVGAVCLFCGGALLAANETVSEDAASVEESAVEKEVISDAGNEVEDPAASDGE